MKFAVSRRKSEILMAGAGAKICVEEWKIDDITRVIESESFRED